MVIALFNGTLKASFSRINTFILGFLAICFIFPFISAFYFFILPFERNKESQRSFIPSFSSATGAFSLLLISSHPSLVSLTIASSAGSSRLQTSSSILYLARFSISSSYYKVSFSWFLLFSRTLDILQTFQFSLLWLQKWPRRLRYCCGLYFKLKSPFIALSIEMFLILIRLVFIEEGRLRDFLCIYLKV